jgi:hypothetical protein
VRECIEEVSSPGGSPVAATELLELLIRSVVEAQGKGGVASDGLLDSEGVHSWGGTGMWGMRVCELWV